MTKSNLMLVSQYDALQAAIDKALQGPGVTEIVIPCDFPFQGDTMLQAGVWEIGPGTMILKEVAL